MNHLLVCECNRKKKPTEIRRPFDHSGASPGKMKLQVSASCFPHKNGKTVDIKWYL